MKVLDNLIKDCAEIASEVRDIKALLPTAPFLDGPNRNEIPHRAVEDEGDDE